MGTKVADYEFPDDYFSGLLNVPLVVNDTADSVVFVKWIAITNFSASTFLTISVKNHDGSFIYWQAQMASLTTLLFPACKFLDGLTFTGSTLTIVNGAVYTKDQ